MPTSPKDPTFPPTQKGDADLWEYMVAQGVPKDVATQSVNVRRQQRGAEVVGAAPETPAPKEPLVGKDALRSLGQGALYGWEDEVVGGLRGLGPDLGTVMGAPSSLPSALVAHAADVNRAVDEERAGIARYKGAHPAIAAALELGGGAATALLGGAALKGLGLAGEAAAPTISGALKAGAGFGAIAGAGGAEGGLKSRAAGAALGAGLGAATGGLVHGGIVAGRSVFASPVVRAADLLANALGRDKTTIEEIAARAARLPATSRATLPELAAMVPAKDAAEAAAGGMRINPARSNTMGLARVASNTPSEGSQQLADALSGRATDEPAAILETLQRTTGIGRASVPDAIDRIVERRAANAAADYGALRDLPISDPRVFKALERPQFAKAYERAVRIRDNEIAAAGLRGEQPPAALPSLDDLLHPLGSVADQLIAAGVSPEKARAAAAVGYAGAAEAPGHSIPFGVLEQVKRGMDDLIKETGEGGLRPNEMRSLGDMQRAYVKLLDEVTPNGKGGSLYAAARDKYAGETAMRDAMLLGRSFGGMSADDLHHTLKGMGDSEREAFRLGAMQNVLEDALGRVKEGRSGVPAIFGSPQQEARLRALFPDTKAGQEAFVQAKVELRGRLNEAIGKNFMYAGSQTEPRQAARQDFERSLDRFYVPHYPRHLGFRFGAQAANLLLRNLTRGRREQAVNALAPYLKAGAGGRQELLDAVAKYQDQLQALAEAAARGLQPAARLGGAAGGAAAASLLSP